MLNGRGNLQKALSKFSDNQQWSSELDSVSVKNARWPLGLPPGGHFLNPNTPLYHSYHSRRVIARSGSGSPLNHKWRTLARATSGSLTTRIPKVLEVRGCAECLWRAGRNRVLGSNPSPLSSGTLWESRYGVTSNDRTYRRSEVAALKGQNELKGNRGSTLKRPKQGKSCSVFESKGNSTEEELKLG